MKKILLSVFVSGTVLTSAQPVIQEPNFMPIGFSASIAVASGTVATSAGANQTWNLSGLTAATIGTMSVVSSGPCSSTYPTANWVESLPNATHHYYARTASQIEAVAENIPTNCTGGTSYTDTKITLKFPFNYTDNFTDPFINTAGSGTASVVYDGYGTLITPTATLTNVARLTVTDGGGTSLQWFTTGNPSYIACFTTGSSTVFFENPMVGISEPSLESALQVYPNPSTGIFTLETGTTEVQTAEVFDVHGKQVLLEMITEKGHIDGSSLPDGVYTLRIKTAEGVLNKKLIVLK